MEEQPYVQPEGFKLMCYRCPRGHEELIWNSRNAVTPFIVHCAQCKAAGAREQMQHINWQDDVYAPDHVPKKGDRIFVDLTMERARKYRQQYVNEWWEKPVYGVSLKDSFPTKEAAVEQLAQADMDSFAPHAPSLIVVE